MNRDPGIRYLLDAERFAAAFEARVLAVNKRRHCVLMESSHWSELATDIGCGTPELEAYASGEAIPEVRLVKLARALEVDPATLIVRRPALVEMVDA